MSQLDEEQLDQLRIQILAFKLICSNVPVPAGIQNRLIYNSAIASHHAEVMDQVQPMDGNTVPPGSSVALRLLYGALHGTRPESVCTTHLNNQFPMVVPEPLNTVSLVMQRERMIEERIRFRTEQLERLAEPTMDSAKLEAVIEYKALRLAEHQKRVRDQVVGGLKRLMGMNTLQYSKMGKRSALRTGKFVERERVRKEKSRNMELVGSISERAKELQNVHRAKQQQRSNKIGRAILALHSNYEKEEIKRLDRLARDRISALKADDEEAYLKLLDQQKDTRLTYLIRQTDLYLESLAHSVLAHKQGGQEYVAPIEGGKLDYYSVAHSQMEEIAEQPGILVGGLLKEYQLKGLQWMVSLYNNKLNGILADEMGLGKTIQTIALISYLLEKKGQAGPYLVIVPLSTMANWAVEFEKWAPSIVRLEYKGGPSTRKSFQRDLKHVRFNVMLTTYEYVIKDKAALGKIKWLYIVVDEGHRMKNINSKLTCVLSTNYASMYRMILTGTPLQNKLPELWALLNFVLPKIFNSKQGFDEWFNAPLANTGEKLELNEEEMLLVIRRLHKVLRPFLLRRLKKDVERELPEKIEKVIRCRMSGLQRRLYEITKEKSLGTETDGRHSGMKRFNNILMQLRKICNHPFVFEEVERQLNPHRVNNEMLYRVSGKFELLSRILPKLQASGHRVLVFFQMTMVMTVMEDFLTMEGYRYLRLDGSTKSEERSELLKKFNAEDSPYFLFLLSTRAGGLGLNLQSADTVIIFDSDWNPHQDLQAQDRAHRIGQTREVRIFRLVMEGSVEELILARAQFKLGLDGKIIQAGKFDQKSTNEEREAILRSLLDMEIKSRQGEESQEVFDDEELNELLARNDEEVELFRRMDQEREALLEQKHGKGGYCRLITEQELPQVYLETQKVPSEEVELGRGRRIRSRVVYGHDENEPKRMAVDSEESSEE